MVPQTLNLGNSMKYLFILGNATDTAILFRDMPYCLPLFSLATVCWCLFLLLFHGSSWTWNGKLAFKSIRAGYCWQSAMAILDVPEPQNLQPWDVVNLTWLCYWLDVFFRKMRNHKTFRKSSRIAIWICSNFFHGRPKRRPKSDEGCRGTTAKRHQLFGWGYLAQRVQMQLHDLNVGQQH